MLNKLFSKKHASQEAALKDSLKGLQMLKSNLQDVERMLDPFEQILFFFQTTSPWQDRFKGRCNAAEFGTYESMSSLEKIFWHLNEAGRNQYGFNRTEPDELITPDKIYLGNTHQIWTNTLVHWRQQRADTTLDPHNRKVVTLIERQAKDFVTNHLSTMITLIDQIRIELGLS